MVGGSTIEDDDDAGDGVVVADGAWLSRATDVDGAWVDALDGWVRCFLASRNDRRALRDSLPLSLSLLLSDEEESDDDSWRRRLDEWETVQGFDEDADDDDDDDEDVEDVVADGRASGVEATEGRWTEDDSDDEEERTAVEEELLLIDVRADSVLDDRLDVDALRLIGFEEVPGLAPVMGREAEDEVAEFVVVVVLGFDFIFAFLASASCINAIPSRRIARAFASCKRFSACVASFASFSTAWRPIHRAVLEARNEVAIVLPSSLRRVEEDEDEADEEDDFVTTRGFTVCIARGIGASLRLSSSSNRWGSSSPSPWPKLFFFFSSPSNCSTLTANVFFERCKMRFVTSSNSRFCRRSSSTFERAASANDFWRAFASAACCNLMRI